MQKLTIEQIENGNGFASPELRQKARELAEKHGVDVLLNCAYTDYGGDFLDRVYIEHFRRNEPDRIVWEPTGWSGENAFIALRPDEWQEHSQYPLVGDTEDTYTELEAQLYAEMADSVIENLEFEGYEFDKEKVRDWIQRNAYGYYRLYPNFVDYSESEVFGELEKAGLIKPKAEHEPEPETVA